MKRFVIFIFVCLSIVELCGNARFPFYETGGVSDLRVFFPRDSVHFAKIKLEKKETVVLLYPGYSVVRNDYYFRNSSDSVISLFLGFPFSMSVLSDQFGAVHIDSAVVIEAYTNGASAILKKCESPIEESRQSHGWNVWENVFKPNEITHIQVLSIVATRSKLMTNDWENYDNSLALLTNFSRRWKDSIVEMRVLVKLGAGIEFKDVIGVSPVKFKSDGKEMFFWSTNNFEPSKEQNVIFRYAKKTDQEAVSQLTQNSKVHFKEILAVNLTEVEDSLWVPFQTSNFGYIQSESSGYTLIYFIIGLGILIMIGVPILIAMKLKGVNLPKQ